MRISEYFHLGRTQGALDFVDVDTSADVPVFVDSRAARRQKGSWGESCRDFLDTHIREVVSAVNADNRKRLYYLIATGEANETHLGWSKGDRSRGRGGREAFADLLASSTQARIAAGHEFVQGLEDAMLFVKGIGPDLVSDQAIHVLRGALIGYTQAWCKFLGIRMEQQHAGRTWHPTRLEWTEVDTQLPRTDFGPLLLVPRSIVRYQVSTDADRYYNGYVAPLLERVEIIEETSIVREYKNGRRYVPRADLHKKYPANKPAIVQYTIDHPDALAKYHESDEVDRRFPPLGHPEWRDYTNAPLPDFQELFEAVAAIRPGFAGAYSFHRSVEALLTALFYPALGNSHIEKEIHDGRKRIDLTYDNIATEGFFRWLTLNNVPSAIVPVECKNYSKDPANEELDQLSGRFSPARGMVGILVSRTFLDKSLFLNRCRDTAKDGRGFILPLDDEDLHELADYAEQTKMESRKERTGFPLLWERFKFLNS